MSTGHAHPSRPGESIRATARVRHRNGREGRVAEGSPAQPDEVLVLFDGASTPRSVQARNLVYLDAEIAAPNPGAARP